jgi:FG-GAP-like repeat/FG-GAP repeat
MRINSNPLLVAIVSILLISVNTRSNPTAIKLHTNSVQSGVPIGIEPDFIPIRIEKDQIESKQAQSDFSAKYFWDGNANGPCQLNILGNNHLDDFAVAIAIGDINGDGKQDIVVGAGRVDGVGVDSVDCGNAYIFFGGTSLSPDSLRASNADVVIVGHNSLFVSWFGEAMTIGDFNGDDTMDLVVGANADEILGAPEGSGVVYMFFGGQIWPASINLNTTSADVTLYCGSNESGIQVQAGASVEHGDINGDGIDDLLIFGPGAESVDIFGSVDASGIWIIPGKSNWPTVVPLYEGQSIGSENQGAFLVGADTYDGYIENPPSSGIYFRGSQQLACGDVNNDGLDDILIAFPGADGPSNADYQRGEVRILYGYSALGLLDSSFAPDYVTDQINLKTQSNVVIYGEDYNDRTYPVESFDVNHDNISDIVFASRYGDGPDELRTDAGELYTIFGGASLSSSYTMPASANVVIYGRDAGDGIQGTMKTDLNNDGFNELWVSAGGADGPNNSRLDCGETKMFFRPDTLPSIIDLSTAVVDATFFGADLSGRSGAASIQSGDITGDNRVDFVMGTRSGYWGSCCTSTPGGLVGIDGSVFGTGDVDGDGLVDPCDTDTLAFIVTPEATGDVADVKVGDLDRDNASDIVYCGLTSPGLFIAYGQSGGGFETPVDILSIMGAGIQLDFVNADTLLDIVAATTDSVFVILNNGNRSYTINRFPSSGAMAGNFYDKSPQVVTVPSVTSGYFNNDGNLDILVSPHTLYTGDGSGGISALPSLPFDVSAVSVADVNGDYIDDIAVVSGDSVELYTNDGSATFTQSASQLIGTSDANTPTRIITSDFNGDGTWDAAALINYADSTNSAVLLVYGNGTGGISDTERLVVAGDAYSMDKADPNKDGRLDLAVTNASSTQLDIFAGSPAGFTGPFTVDIQGGTNVPLVAAALDQDRDGNADFITGTAGGGSLFIVGNEGTNLPVIPDEMFVTAFTNATLRVSNPVNQVISRNQRTVAGSDYWRLDFNGDDSLDEQTMDYNLIYGDYKIVVRPKGGGGEHELNIAIGIDGSQRRLLASELPFGMGKSNSDAAVGDSVVLYFPMEATPTILPAVGLATNTPKPTFNWSLRDNPSATQFQFQLDEHPLFPTPRIDQVIPTATPSYTPPTLLGTDSVYYWRFREFVGGVWSGYTNPFAVYVTGCCINLRGNANGGVGDAANVADVAYLVKFLFQSGPPPPCPDEANVNGTGSTNVSDVAYLVKFLFQSGPPPAACP